MHVRYVRNRNHWVIILQVHDFSHQVVLNPLGQRLAGFSPFNKQVVNANFITFLLVFVCDLLSFILGKQLQTVFTYLNSVFMFPMLEKQSMTEHYIPMHVIACNYAIRYCKVL